MEQQSNVRLIDADRALNLLGKWGRYQLWVFAMCNVIWIFIGFQTMSTVFVGDTPPYECQLSEDAEMALNESGVDNWHGVCLLENNSTNKTIPCGLKNTEFVFHTDGYGKTIVSEWNLVCSNRILSEIASSVYMFGFLIGSALIPSASDKWGRKPCFLISQLTLQTLGTASSFSPNFAVFATLRFFSGVCLGGAGIASWVLACESVVPDFRAYGCLVQGIAWSLGYCLVGPIAYFVPNWRPLMRVISIPGFITILLYWLIPESLHFYVANNRTEEAERWILRAAKWNRMKIDLDDCLVKDDDLQVAHKPHRKSSIVSICVTPLVLLHTVLIAYMWLCNTFVYYGLSLFSSKLAGSRHVNYVLSGFVELPGYFLLVPILNRLGRRRGIGGLHVLSGVALLVLMLIPDEAGNGVNLVPLKTALWMIGKFAIGTSFMGVWLYGAEIFPTTVRTAGVGIGNVAARTGGVLAPYVRLLADVNPLFPPTVFGISSLAAAVVIGFLPETQGRNLPEDIDDVEPGPWLQACLKRRARKKKHGEKVAVELGAPLIKSL